MRPFVQLTLALALSASPACEATRTEGRAVQADYGSSPKIDSALRITELKRRYAGKISAGIIGADAFQQAARVRELMKEWNPIGFMVADLLEIMGRPSSESDSGLRYSFDQGFNGTAWEFFVENGVITGVIAHAID